MIYNSALNNYEKICSSCTVYIILFVIAFLMNISISSGCFYFHWYLKKDINGVKFNTNTQRQIYQANKWEVSKKKI